MRSGKYTGLLTFDVPLPIRKQEGVRVVFDEGAELNTKAVWLKHNADWDFGHPAFVDDPPLAISTVSR